MFTNIAALSFKSQNVAFTEVTSEKLFFNKRVDLPILYLENL